MGARHRHPVIDGKKPCNRCGSSLPFDADHFCRDGVGLKGYCKPCGVAYSKAYRATEAGTTNHRRAEAKSRAENLDVHKARDAAKYQKNADAVKARSKRWQEANRDRAQSRRRARYASDASFRAKYQAWNRASRDKRNGADGTFSAADVQAQFNKQNGCCFYCTKPLRRYHIEHKTPLSRGGSNWPENIVCACAVCNLRKGTQTAEEFLATRRAA